MEQPPITSAAARQVITTEDDPGSVLGFNDPTVDLWLWRRKLPALFANSAARLAQQPLSLRLTVNADCAPQRLAAALADAGVAEPDRHLWTYELCSMAELVIALGHGEVLVRLQSTGRLNEAPLFHVDGGRLRLLCTYAGSGTEWLPEHAVNRVALGRQRNHRHANAHIASSNRAIQRTLPGWVAIIRGASGPSTRRGGLVHRSPPSAAARLLLRIDPA